EELGCELPPADFEQSNWHMFQPLLPLDRMTIGRGEFIDRMKAKKIGVGVHYPAMHLFALYRSLGFRQGQYPAAEKIGRSTVTLPLYPAMTDADVDRVCQAVSEVLHPVIAR
ncbi:MAG: aminotransferase DegT, partial [Acidobacteria bacterium]